MAKSLLQPHFRLRERFFKWKFDGNCAMKLIYISLSKEVPPSGSRPELDLLSAIVPFQYLGWHLARGKGIVPEKMRYPGLSQKLKIKTRVGT